MPVVTGSLSTSTVHSVLVADAFCLEAPERIGVSSGARIVKTSVKSSRLETADPGFVVSYVFENAMIIYFLLLD
jgi:outer membrane receptor for monomeric catechols